MGLVDFSLGDIGGVFTSIRESITGEKIKDPMELAKLDLQLEQLIQASRDGQISINKIEAAHNSIFVAGWRPFIGWVCGVALAYAYIIQPLAEWVIKLNGIDVVMPTLNTDTLYQLIIALLGMATLRTYEKTQKVAREK